MSSHPPRSFSLFPFYGKIYHLRAAYSICFIEITSRAPTHEGYRRHVPPRRRTAMRARAGFYRDDFRRFTTDSRTDLGRRKRSGRERIVLRTYARYISIKRKYYIFIYNFFCNFIVNHPDEHSHASVDQQYRIIRYPINKSYSEIPSRDFFRYNFSLSFL